ncbi:hypothetical protein L6R53_12465 [Myxococcota bacterium]|nr:hypothetical protein [Myxococcota bacterium]
MSEFDSILARSRAPGRFVERRRFSLSREKAVEKLREFSLRHPEQYILELVQAAVFAGARWIAIDVSSERLFFAWVGGRSFQRAELENVFDYLFADRAAAETRHLVQLAVALNALLQRRPREVRVESGDGTAAGTVRMDLDRDGKGQLGQPEEAFQGTYLVVEHGTSWSARFSGEDFTKEQGLVEERCQYSPVPILLNYRAPFGYRANREIRLYGADHAVSFDQDGRRGARGLPSVSAPAREDGVRLVVGGVWITTRRIDELGRVPGRGGEPRHLVGVVCDDRLRKTADQGDIVQDARFVDMLHAVQPLATALIRGAPGLSGYSPPDLPRRVAEAAKAGPTRAAGPEPLPLPSPIPQVAPRPELELEHLVGLPPGTPVFWIDPTTADALGGGADPDRFPYRLLLLSPGQAVSLSRAAPRLSLGQLGSAADAEFVARVAARQAEVLRVELPFDGSAGLGGRGRLELRLHLVGPRPAWGVEGPREVPIHVRVARRSAWCGALNLGLPGVSVLVELDGGAFDEHAGPATLSHLVRRNAWRLLSHLQVSAEPDGAAPAPLPGPLRALGIAVLAAGLVPHFHRDATGVRLAARLPSDWGPLAAALAALPLAQAVDGPLRLRDLVDLVTGEGAPPAPAAGTTDRPLPRVRDLRDPADLALLAPLEQRLGPGHLRVAGQDGRALLAVAQDGLGITARWSRWQVDHASPGPHVRAMLWVADSLAPTLRLAGWTLLPPPFPGIALAVRDPGELPDLRGGLRLLYEELARAVREDQWAGLLPDPELVDRARQLGRLALIGLAAATGHLAGRVLPASDGVGWRRLDELSADGALRIAPRHGPRVAEADTVLLTWDELRSLEAAGLPLPLRFDDAPEVWDGLVDPPPEQPVGTPGAHGWLIRERLRVPGLDGWLGLRWPYDPTSAVLLQQSGELLALTQVDRHVPCHGLAWTTGATDTVSSVQRDLLELARLHLYQQLAERLAGGSDPSWAAEAERYALDFAVQAWRDRQVRHPEGTAGRLLATLRLQDPQGRPLGSLEAWLAREPEQRPTPAGHAARYLGVRQAEAGAEPARGDYEAALAGLERRLSRALSLAGREPDLRCFFTRKELGPRRPPVRILDGASHHGTVSLELNEHHPLVYTALAEAGDAREILLLEAARLAIQVVREREGAVDLPQVHQLLAAQRG